MSATLPRASGDAPAGHSGPSMRVLAIYSLATITLLLALSLPFSKDYVGADNDDAMRLVVVRDLLAGQGWFDTMQYRLGLEGGTQMHWSRFIDLPIANLISFFSLFVDDAQAERLALTVWPPLLVIPLLFGMGLAAHRLGGTAAMHATMLLTAILAVSLNRFQPGSIDHHNVQLGLIALITAMLLDPAHRARSYAVAGALAGFAIAIGVETTPLIGTVCLVVALRWAWHGRAYQRAAAAYGLSLAATVTLAFFATVAPSHYGQVTCDSLSYGFYALATFGGGALFLTTSVASGWALRGRLLALGVAGAIIAVAVLTVAPGCLSNPLDALDPLLKTFWLSGVIEAQSVAAQFRVDPGSIGGFYVAGLLAIVICIWRIRGRQSVEAYAVILALLGAAYAVSIFQVRGSIFANLLSALPLGLMIVDLRRAANADPKNLRLGLAFAGLTLASVPPAWAVAGALLPGISRDQVTEGLVSGPEKATCTGGQAMAVLAAEPAGVVAGASDLGTSILRYTHHRVLSPPYHRNQGGMLTELHIGLSNPNQAEAFLRGAGVTLLAFCAADSQTRSVARAEPEGLYAGLYEGRVPHYLEPINGDADAALKLFRVRPE
jgi:hypothetical protein